MDGESGCREREMDVNTRTLQNKENENASLKNLQGSICNTLC